MVDQQRVIELILRQLRHTLTQPEKSEMEAWIQESPKHKAFMETRMLPEVLTEELRALVWMKKKSIKREYNQLQKKKQRDFAAAIFRRIPIKLECCWRRLIVNIKKRIPSSPDR